MLPERFQQVSKALADPQRFAILERIASNEGELACKAIVQELSISQATVSHHLKELAEAGLITIRREAQSAYLSPNRTVLQDYRRELGRRMGLDR